MHQSHLSRTSHCGAARYHLSEVAHQLSGACFSMDETQQMSLLLAVRDALKMALSEIDAALAIPTTTSEDQ